VADLALTSDDRRLLAVDEDAGELIAWERHEGDLKLAYRLPVGQSPVSVRISADGSRAFLASLWSHELSIVELPEIGRPRVARTVALPFAPRAQLLLPGDRTLIVADSFGGRLAVIDVQSGNMRRVHELPAHNIRGLAVRGDRLLVAHQRLNLTAVTDFD